MGLNRKRRRGLAKQGASGDVAYERLRALRNNGRFAEAAELYRGAVGRDPKSVEAWCGLGVCLGQIGRPREGLQALRIAVALGPTMPESWSECAEILFALGRKDQAVRDFGRAAFLVPGNPHILRKLGSLLLEVGAPADAAPVLATAAQALPDQPDIQVEFAQALLGMGQTDLAIATMTPVLHLVDQSPGAWTVMAMLFAARGQLDLAADALRKVALLAPHNAKSWRNLGSAVSDQGRLDLATRYWGYAGRIAPDVGLRFRLAIALDPIEPSGAAIAARRRRLIDDIAALERDDLTLTEPAKSIGIVPFYLAYHGEDDRPVLTRLVKTLLKACPSLGSVAPHVAGWRPRPRPRIAMISRQFREHTVGALIDGFFDHRDRARFELVICQAPGPQDAVGRRFAERADGAIQLADNLDGARAAVASLQPDIVFYLDLGMDTLTWYLAMSRLAPVQATSWGHPDTTGMPSIDLFLSSAFIEPPNGQDHYSEKLVLLPTLPGTIARPPKSTDASRAEFGLPADKRIYLCPQSLFKLHPTFDPALKAILDCDPAAEIVFISGMATHWTNMIKNRLAQSLGPLAGRLRFLDRIVPARFTALLSVADVLIDPPLFSGGKTSLEGFAMGKPTVTWDAPFMRGRVTLGCYRAMEIDGPVARDARHFAELAVAVARDGAALRSAIAARADRLFDPVPGVRAMEDVFAQALIEATT